MNNAIIDLRSDTVTKPSAAEVGDDIFGEDPTVNRLQAKVAELLGKEAALFVPSGTMGNQLCIKVHTRPGDEVIVERGCHVFNYETGAIAFLSGVQAHTVDGVRGVITPDNIIRAIRPKAYYMPRTSLVCVENTHNRAGGTICPLDVIKSTSELCRSEGLKFHLDGARLWNACVETGITPREYASHFDSVSVCLSKGLGAPVGSVIAGTADFIAEARRHRKIFGGGMRQAGILAAAGIHALDHNMVRLKEDHAKARFLGEELSKVKAFEIDLESVQTNIVIISLEKSGVKPEDVLSRLKAKGVLLTPGNFMGIRAVTHLDVSMEDVQTAAAIIRQTIS